MASPIQWTWTWANYRRWWGTGKPGMLQSMGSQRVGYNLLTEQQQQHHQWKGEQFRGSLLSRLFSQPCQKFSDHFRSFSKHCLRNKKPRNLWLLLLVTDKNKFSVNCNLKKRQTLHIYVLIARHTYPWIHKLQRTCFDLYTSSKHKQIMFLLIWFCPFTSDQNRSKEGKWAVITREEDASCVRNVMENGERKTIISSC